MLLREETPMGPDIMMVMTNMKASHGITTMPQIIDQPGVLITEENL